MLATHSPLVISELPQNASLYSLDGEDLPPTSKLTGGSTDYLLAEAFGLPTNGNLYIKNLIVDALRLVADGKARSKEFATILLDLNRLVEDLNEKDAVRTT